MTVQTLTPADISRQRPTRQPQLRAVLCGSFRRDPVGLRETFEALKEHFQLLAPRSLEFVDPSAPFVRLADEHDESALTVEQRHLEAVSNADFVWLHAPDGYVGLSASMEIGHAHALGIPVFSDAVLSDEMLDGLVRRVSSPVDVEVDQVTGAVAPGAGIEALQNYYGRVAARRGWDGEGPRDTLLMLTEELGELARAVRKTEGLSRAGGYQQVNVAHEVADVQLLLVHLANSLGIDLGAAVSEKERINAARVGDDAAARVSA